jgi:hypothetical protein
LWLNKTAGRRAKSAGQFASFQRSLSAVLRDVSGLGTFGALNNLKFDRISFLQGSIPVAHDGGVVYEHIRPVVATYESIALGIIKPLDVPFHFAWPPYSKLKLG